MFSDYELKLLSADCREFPLLQAVIAARARCSTCRHGKVNLHMLLRTAVTKYKNDKKFKDFCGRLFKLPCSIAGVVVEKE